MADGTLQAGTPLPPALGGTQLLLGGEPLPLLFVTPGQVNGLNGGRHTTSGYAVAAGPGGHATATGRRTAAVVVRDSWPGERAEWRTAHYKRVRRCRRPWGARNCYWAENRCSCCS